MIIVFSLPDLLFSQIRDMLPPYIQIQRLQDINRADLDTCEADLIVTVLSSKNVDFPWRTGERIIFLNNLEDSPPWDAVEENPNMNIIDFPCTKDLFLNYLIGFTPASDQFDIADEMGLIGESRCIASLKKDIKRYAPHSETVSITGETGTGKEIAASALHNLSGREGPFLAVNCAAIPENLLESELFGVVKGAYTGADHNKKGYFESAQGGTLLLDEIADMPLQLQIKLLRVLDSKIITPLGSTTGRKLDVRIVSATSKDLRKMVREGLFRSDLYYRLNILTLDIPALRQRKSDIPLLARHFLSDDDKGIKAEAVLKLINHDWPGNVRELRATIRKGSILSGSRKELSPGHIKFI